MTLLDTLADKAALWHPERNGQLTPADVSFGSRVRVWWCCEQGHEWQAMVYSVASDGCGCPYCAGKKAIPGETDLATTHPRVALLWHEKNSVSPRQVSAGSRKKAWWRCEQGHQWEAAISSVAMDGCGCPYCAGKRAIPGETDLATVCPDIASQWDAERNGCLNPRDVLPSSHDKVWWLCERSHPYQAVIFSRTREKGTGCPYCAGKKAWPGFNDLQTLKPKIASEWHPTLNGDLKPSEVTLGSNKKVWWQCPDGHVWRAAVYSRTRKKGSGCPVCQGTVKEPKKIPLRKTRTAIRRDRNTVNPSTNIQF